MLFVAALRRFKCPTARLNNSKGKGCIAITKLTAFPLDQRAQKAFTSFDYPSNLLYQLPNTLRSC
ncbi:hypothetical protein AG1IA_00225 [Rhizoctonia solani AG-1 IA]|uniref:Uncharacterized protein n=1 Tax=Thanatephorus cucumeris (strain AG1-IA) TaxID=983506 RepID=L8XAS0_THACA|nr:hypothetical protein AG1IA_00225 [Rhizoctonia solani AG-1 IA]